jgi:Ca-activated chloride channel homolog
MGRSYTLMALFTLPTLALAVLQEPGQFTISDNVNLVLLDVSVKSPHGGYVSGLAESDFHVQENGRPRQITQFANADRPVTLGLVVDNSGSMRTKRPDVILAGLAFAKESNSRDEFFVVNFNDTVVRGLPSATPFTDNLQLLHAALYYGQAAGKTALYDAIDYSLKHLERGHLDKRTLVVVSDGGDNASRIHFQELMQLIEQSRATIYTVGLLDPEDRDLNPGVLRKIASVSGGRYFQPATLNDIIAAFHEISKDIRARYTIGFVPDEHDKRNVRSIRVTAEKDDHQLTVRSRTSYSLPPVNHLVANRH